MATPLAFNETIGEAVVNARKLGLTQAACAAVAGVTPRTLTNWLVKGESGDERLAGFVVEFRRADSDIEKKMVQCIFAAAEKGDWRAAETWLRAFRAEYRQTKSQTIEEDRQALLDAITEHVPPEAAEKLLAAIAARG